MDATQYMNQSRFAEGLNALAENFDVSGTIERIGGNINVYNRILSSFYLQNKDAEMDLRNKFNRNFRLFRNKLHNIRTGCRILVIWNWRIWLFAWKMPSILVIRTM